MKLKYNFVLRNVAGTEVAIVVGEGSKYFNGMIKLNQSGKFIFELLNFGDVTMENIVSALMSEYNIDNALASETAKEFIDYLMTNGLLEE